MFNDESKNRKYLPFPKAPKSCNRTFVRKLCDEKANNKTQSYNETHNVYIDYPCLDLDSGSPCIKLLEGPNQVSKHFSNNTLINSSKDFSNETSILSSKSKENLIDALKEASNNLKRLSSFTYNMVSKPIVRSSFLSIKSKKE